MGGQRNDVERQPENSDDVGFVIHLYLSSAESLWGTVTRSNDKVPHPFSGWLELMVVIERLRTETRSVQPDF